jgi:hypothetical protein
MNRYAILNVDKGQFLTPIDGKDVFTDRVELAEFLSEQKELHNLDDISHLRVVSVLIDRETDIEIADVVEEVEHLENQADREDVIDKKLNGGED